MTVTTDITINGETFDITSPCDVAAALRKAQLRLATGGTAIEIEIDGERARYAKPSDSTLASLIAQYTQDCQATNGKSRRRRRPVFWR